MDVKKLLKKMTLDEKIGQLQQVYVNPDNVGEVADEIKKGMVGSCIIAINDTAGNTDDDRAYKGIAEELQKAAREHTRLGIPLLVGRDIIHGDKTIFPIPLAQAATWDIGLIKEAAQRMMSEAASDGINWTFAPMLDLVRDPRWGRVIESCGEDPYLGARFARASVEGIQSSGQIAACAKHFVGYGSAEGGRDYNKGEITDYELRNMYLPAFKSAVDAGVKTVMNSFSTIGGIPSVANKYLFRQILRNEMGFDGFVISDWGSIQWQIFNKTCENKEECAYNSINAGIDMEMVTTCYRESLKKLLQKGRITERFIDSSVLNILKVKNEIGLFEEQKPVKTYNDNMEFAKKIAMNSMILLKNNNNTLPIDKDIKSILIVGPMANEKRALSGSWCAGGCFDKTPTLYEAVTNKFKGCKVEMVDNLYESAHGRAITYDMVIFALGEYHYVTGERVSMANVELSPYQMTFVKKISRRAKRTVSVVFGGRPLALTELCECSDAVLYAWHSGVMAAPACAEILSGDFVPCGKAPMTFVRSTGQIPFYYDSPYMHIRVKGHNQYYSQDAVSCYNEELPIPLFPFGYGLSYTTFEYANAAVENDRLTQSELNNGKKFKISADVKNTGDYSANEVVQLYISAKKSSKQRPVRELKGFKKIFIEKQSTYKVEFELGREEIGYYPEKELVVENVKYDIFIGRDCYAKKAVTVEVTD